MPFLFIDYDQGTGGERFCSKLSCSPECEPLESVRYKNGRTKVKDVFDQEFLKPNPEFSNISSHKTLYTVVPVHRHTDLAKERLKDVRSIRIALPTTPELFDKLNELRVQKVYLTVEPQEYFIGLLKLLNQTATNPDFIRQVKYGMLTVEVILLSQGIEPTQKNIDNYIAQVRQTIWPGPEYMRSAGLNEFTNTTFETLVVDGNPIPEPDIDYDLVIPYEDLIYNPAKVKQQIETTFNITIEDNWLEEYGQELA